MTDRLTDDQLRDISVAHPPSHDEYKMSTELLALRGRMAREAQLEAALWKIVYNDDGVCEQIALVALAQPAESGATPFDTDESGICTSCGLRPPYTACNTKGCPHDRHAGQREQSAATSEEGRSGAREIIASARMRQWPGYQDGTLWASLPADQHIYWLESVSDVDAEAVDAALDQARAQAAERESCARIADDFAQAHGNEDGEIYIASRIAAAIRSQP